MVRRVVVLVVVAALLAGCAARGVAPIPQAPVASEALGAPDNASNARHRKARLVIRFRIPKARRHHAHYISAATEGATLQFAGPSNVTQSIALTPSDPRCVGTPLVCTIAINLLPGSYNATVTTYDAAPIGGAIPGSAKVLSIAKNVAKTIEPGKANGLNFTLDGVASALVVAGLPSAVAGTAFSEAKTFSVTAQDAAGYTIVGTYANPITVTDSDASSSSHVQVVGSFSPTATMNSSSDVIKITYNGVAIPPATITAASTGATNGTGIFAPSFTMDVSTGLIGTGVTETISGAGFVDGSTDVQVSGTGVTVSNVTVVSGTTLTAHFFIDPSATTGAREVSVTSPSGTSGTAPSFTISNTGVDVVTLSTDGTTGSSPGLCPAGASGELRYAICNATAGHTIVFDTQSMCGSDECTITLAAPLPPIQQDQTIDGGSSTRVTIDGNSSYRVFWVDTGTVTLADLTIQHGSAHGGNGAGGSFAIGAGGGGAGLGAGLLVNKLTAVVTVRDDSFLKNGATGGNGGSYPVGTGAGGGGGGLGGDGAVGITSHPLIGGGGGGVLISATGTAGANGGGGGGGAQDGASGASGGAAFAGNTGGSSGGTNDGGTGGFGGGGGGGGPTAANQSAGMGGTGGFGGGGGGGANNSYGGGYGGDGGIGGPGGGGGANGYGSGQYGVPGSAGSLGGEIVGGDAGGYGGGGGAAAGPDIFVVNGTLTTANSASSGASAAGGSGGDDADGSLDGDADATPVYNYEGTINGSTDNGPIANALASLTPFARHLHRPARKHSPKR